MAPYAELHAHSNFSFLEGASHIEEMVLRASELGYRSLALTDHDGLHGAMEFAQCARAWGVRPITGAEVTLSNGHHLTLLCETQRGYANHGPLLTPPAERAELFHAFPEAPTSPACPGGSRSRGPTTPRRSTTISARVPEGETP